MFIEGAARFKADGAAIVGHGDADRLDAIILDELAQGNGVYGSFTHFGVALGAIRRGIIGCGIAVGTSLHGVPPDLFPKL